MACIMKNFIFVLFAAFVWCGADAQELSVSTNVLDYANMGTLNFEAAYGFARHWSVDVGLKYNPFTWGEGVSTKQNRQRSLSAGARYWFWYVYSGWWLEGSARLKEYNIGGFGSEQTVEGIKGGPAFRAGYSYMINRNWNLDFGAGIWGVYDRYVVYSCPSCGKKVEDDSRFFIVPADVAFSVSYIF